MAFLRLRSAVWTHDLKTLERRKGPVVYFSWEHTTETDVGGCLELTCRWARQSQSQCSVLWTSGRSMMLSTPPQLLSHAPTCSRVAIESGTIGRLQPGDPGVAAIFADAFARPECARSPQFNSVTWMKPHVSPRRCFNSDDVAHQAQASGIGPWNVEGARKSKLQRCSKSAGLTPSQWICLHNWE